MPPTLHVPAFIVIGGGAIGAGSARQLLRAQDAGRLQAERIVVVDRNPHCRAAALPRPVEVAVGEWGPWLAANLGSFAPDDHFVPDHFSPHLLRQWLVGEIVRRGGRVLAEPTTAYGQFPYDAPTREGDRALSYATWMCPPRCIEPALCPHTRGAKDWSLAADLDVPPKGRETATPIVLPCLHLVWGIGTVPMARILAARDQVTAPRRGPRLYRIATASHCHGLVSTIRVS
jgi:hypothetical protein